MGNDTFTFSEKVDGLVCRPCIKEDGMPYGIDLCVDKFPVTRMACEIGAVIEAAACVGENT